MRHYTIHYEVKSEDWEGLDRKHHFGGNKSA